MLLKILFALLLGVSLVFMTWRLVVQAPLQTPQNDVVSSVDFVDKSLDGSGRSTVTRLPDTILTTSPDTVVSDKELKEKSVAVELDKDFFRLEESSTLFDFFYDNLSGAITITLLGSDTKKAREVAEEYILQNLPYSKKQWCDFDVGVITNQYENPQWSGIDLGLSFCSSSVKL